MSVELLYTSAAQGLKQGSRGFCTVISTAGMPLNLATRLESLSAYRHVFAPGHPDAAQNPVSFSHLRLNVGGRPLSILSRISDYGVDYSQRTNKLAHHVVLEGADLVPAGPAWVMSQPGVMRSQWDGQCSTPGSGPAIPATNQSPRVCMRWSGLCGDAGWGGAVAEVFAQPVGKPLWIIFPLNQSSELLALINESIALLAPAQRWQATFSTYATNLPPDADCKVRCVLAGTEDARLAPARGKVIDLSKPLPPIAPTSITPYVLAARNGTPVPGAIPSASTAGATSKPRPPVPHSESADELFDVDQSNLAAGDQITQKSRPSSESKLARSPSAPPAMKNKPSVADSKSVEGLAASSRKLKWSMIGLSVVAALLLACTVILFVKSQPIEIATTNLPYADDAAAEEPVASTGTGEEETSPPAVSQPAATSQPPTTPASPLQSGETTATSNGQTSDVNTEAPTVQSSSRTDEKAKANPPSIAQDSTAYNKPDVLIGEIQAAELLKGSVCVQLEIENFMNLPVETSRFSFEEKGRAYSTVGSLPVDKRPENIKELKCTDAPLKLTIDVEIDDKDIKERARKIKVTWGGIIKTIVGWQNALRNSGFQRPQKLEMLIEKPEEPNGTESVVDLQLQLADLSKRTEEVLEELAQHEADLATKGSAQEARIYFQQYTDYLAKFQELITSLQREIAELTNIDREFDTRTIMYIGKVADGILSEAIELKRSFRLNEKTEKKEENNKPGKAPEGEDTKQPSTQQSATTQ